MQKPREKEKEEQAILSLVIKRVIIMILCCLNI